MVNLDKRDLAILSILQKNARSSFSEIARELGLSDVAVRNRIDKMIDAQVIEGFHVKLNLEKLGFGVNAFIGIKLEKLADNCPTMHKQLESMEEVRELHHVASSFDLILKVSARDNKHLREFIFDKIPRISGFSSLEPIIILETSIEKFGIPLEASKPISQKTPE